MAESRIDPIETNFAWFCELEYTGGSSTHYVFYERNETALLDQQQPLTSHPFDDVFAAYAAANKPVIRLESIHPKAGWVTPFGVDVSRVYDCFDPFPNLPTQSILLNFIDTPNACTIRTSLDDFMEKCIAAGSPGKFLRVEDEKFGHPFLNFEHISYAPYDEGGTLLTVPSGAIVAIPQTFDQISQALESGEAFARVPFPKEPTVPLTRRFIRPGNYNNVVA